MSGASKYFYRAIDPYTCAELLHFHGATSCWEATVWNLTQTIAGCCKYVLPIAIIPLLLKIRRLNGAVLRDSWWIFVEYSLASWMMGGFGLSFMCLFYRILGRFYYTSVMAIPVLCSSSLCAMLFSSKLISMFSHGLFTLAIEVSITRGDTFLLRRMRDSVWMRTLGFMAVNTLLMNALRRMSGPNLWFVQPTKRIATENNEELQEGKLPEKPSCPCHSSSGLECATYIYGDIFKYMKLGLGVEIIKSLIGNANQMKSQPLQFLCSMPGNINCQLPAFLVTYAGLYRYLNCSIARGTSLPPSTVHSLAAFVSGLSFYLYPNTQLLAHAIAITVKLVWSQYLNQTREADRSDALKFLMRFPFARCFYPLAFAYLLQMRVFYPWLAPPVLRNLMNLTTNFKDNQIMSKYHERLLGGTHSPPETLYLFGLERFA